MMSRTGESPKSSSDLSSVKRAASPITLESQNKKISAGTAVMIGAHHFQAMTKLQKHIRGYMIPKVGLAPLKTLNQNIARGENGTIDEVEGALVRKRPLSNTHRDEMLRGVVSLMSFRAIHHKNINRLVGFEKSEDFGKELCKGEAPHYYPIFKKARATLAHIFIALEKYNNKDKILTTFLKHAIEGITFLAKKGLFHQQIDETNFMLDDKGNLVIIDFDTIETLSSSYLILVYDQLKDTFVDEFARIKSNSDIKTLDALLEELNHLNDPPEGANALELETQWDSFQERSNPETLVLIESFCKEDHSIWKASDGSSLLLTPDQINQEMDQLGLRKILESIKV